MGLHGSKSGKFGLEGPKQFIGSHMGPQNAYEIYAGRFFNE